VDDKAKGKGKTTKKVVSENKLYKHQLTFNFNLYAAQFLEVCLQCMKSHDTLISYSFSRIPLLCHYSIKV